MSPDPADEQEESPIPPVPSLTRTEQVVWVTYLGIAILLIAVPILTHTFSLPTVAAFVLLGGAAAMSLTWYRSGELRTAEWLPEEDYEEFLRQLHSPYENPEDAD